MTLEIGVILTILVVALALLATETLRSDVIALLVLAALAGTGSVSPESAIAGFSNPAVVTVWAMYILSAGLTHTGIANILGDQLLRVAGRRESGLVVIIMVTAGGLSSFMNNIGVAALMLPVVVEMARRTEVAASRLLMPMLYGTLLGGLTTLIATAPNLLVSNALAAHDEQPFGLFDFVPVGLGAFIMGTAFISLVGRRFLPERDPGAESQHRSQRNLRAQYGLQEWTFTMTVTRGSVLVGKTLAQSRIGSAAGLIVVAVERQGRVSALPSRNTVLESGDRLMVQGRLDRFNELRRWSDLVIEREAPVLQGLLADRIGLVEVRIAEESALVKELLHHAEFRRRFGANVLAIRRGNLVRRTNLNYVPIRAGDHLLLQGSDHALKAIEAGADFAEVGQVTATQLADDYRMQERAFIVRVPANSGLGGATLEQSRLGDAFDFRLLATLRDGNLRVMPEPDEVILGGDLLLIQGRPEDLDVLRGLQELDISERVSPSLNLFESDRLATVEVTLAPNSPLAGRRVAAVNLREKYGLELVAIWRSGGAIRADLDAQELHFGDALLLLGPRNKLALLRDDPDLLVLSSLGPAVANRQRAPVAALLMLGVIVAAFSGWLPISITAILGATLMVITGCLSMEQAYRSIEWRAIFIIAGMMPLGVAIQESGAAQFVARQVTGPLADFGPWPVIMGLYLMTAAGSILIPSAVLAVLMSPIVISTCAQLGIAPQAAMIALAAACTSFASPFAHPANLLIMGPGGYRFSDYVKVGLPLTLVVFATVMLLLPVFWPLHAG